jgi:hypothetical protein
MSATFIQDEESVVDVEKAGAMMLQDILAMPEPDRTHYLRAWLDYAQFDPNGGMVKLRTPDRGRMVVPFGGAGKTMTFPHTGKEVSRLNALTLLREFGLGGMYHGLNMATGMSRGAYETLQIREPEMAQQYAKQKLEFNDNYLMQVPYGDSDEVELSQEE